MTPKSWPHLLACCLAHSMIGCASWSSAPGEPAELPVPKLSSDAVVLEAVLVRVPDDWDAGGRFWREVDEQHLATDVRRRLQDNGLRTGLVGAQIPDALRSFLSESANPLDLSGTEESPEVKELFQGQQRLQMPAGKTKRVRITAGVREACVILFRTGDDVRAERFDKAVGMMDLRSRPLGDGRVQLEVTPAVEFGNVRQQWISGSGTFQLDVNRPRRLLDELGFIAVLSPGQTLLVAATPGPVGLGGEFFTLPDSHQRSVLLLRLAQTQMDDLFSPARAPEPVVSQPN